MYLTSASGSGASTVGLGTALGGVGAGAAQGAGLPLTGVNAYFLLLAAITVLLMGAALVRIARTVRTPAL